MVEDELRRQESRLTPINDAYPTCKSLNLELRIYRDRGRSSDFTSILGMEPTDSQDRGAIVVNDLGRARETPLTRWFLSSSSQVQSRDVRKHLDWLLSRLAPAGHALRAIQQLEGVRMTVNCRWWSDLGDGGPTIWPEQMQGLTDLNLELTFDIGFAGSDEDD